MRIMPAGRLIAALAIALLSFPALFSGCGENTRQNKDFYTSGSQEADERADQRMAQAQQLKGGSEGSGDLLAPPKKSLYDRLGGDAGLQAISEDFVTRAMADPRVNFNRQGITQGGLSIHFDRSVQWNPTPDTIKALKLHLKQFLEGKEIKGAHANMHISNDEFDASVGDMKATLDKMQVSNTEQKELLAIIETTREEIVTER